MSRLKRFISLLLVALIILLLASLFRSEYVLFKPGSAEDLRDLVTVEGDIRDDPGKFLLVTVAQQRASLLVAAYGFLHPHIEVQRLSEVIPRGMDQQEYRQLLDQWMIESQQLAQVIALRRVGYQVDIISAGTAIVGFLEDSPSEGVLHTGDVIVAVDGTPVAMASEVISAVQDRRVGDPVRMTIQRDDIEMDLEVTTGPHPSDPELPALGIYIQTLHWEPVLPVNIVMETGQIGGPSAGVMFVLEIMNQLDPADITGGRIIAGTGTIDINENIGRIGGVSQKVVAAERSGAEFFIVPEGNYQAAQSAARSIEVVSVSTMQEVLDFLKSLNTAGTSMLPPAGSIAA